MHRKPKKSVIRKPDPELIDDENPEWTEEDFKRARPASEVLREQFGAAIANELLKPRGRPPLEHPKERINIRLSHDVVHHFKGTGPGWQSRIDSVLVEFVKRELRRQKRQ
jgi:uncharacterized protein (DUF4415 family)